MNKDLNNKDFYDYLKEIGIVDDGGILKIKNIYNDIIESNKNLALNKVMCAALIYYLNNLDSTQRNKISLNLILNYLNLGNKNKKEKLLNLIKNKDNINNKLLLLKNFIQWKNSIKYNNNYIDTISSKKSKKNNKNNLHLKNKINNKLNNNSLNKTNTYEYSNFNTYSTNSNNNNNGKNSLLTSKNSKYEKFLDKKEQEELSECTFNPSINKTRSNYSQNNLNTENNNHLNVFDRLYNDNEKYKNKKQLKAFELELLRNNDFTFIPNTIPTPREFTNKSKDNFNKRQIKYFEDKFKNQNKIINENNENFIKNCSFSPKINKNKSNKSLSPAHIRLYEDNKKRKDKINRILYEESKKNCVLGEIDYDKIEELYNSYKKKNIKLQQLQEKVDNEHGVTFSPYIKKNKYYNDLKNSNFYERNMNSLALKNKFIENTKKMSYEKYKANQLFKNEKIKNKNNNNNEINNNLLQNNLISDNNNDYLNNNIPNQEEIYFNNEEQINQEE